MSEEEYEPYQIPVREEDFDETEVGRALNNVMCTAEGRLVIWTILSSTGMHRDEFHGGERDAFEKGKRSIGLQLVSLMQDVDPTIYPRMLLEVAKKEKLRRLEEQREHEKQLRDNDQ